MCETSKARNGSEEFLYKHTEREKFGRDLQLVEEGGLRRSEAIYKGKKLIRVVSLLDQDSIRNIMIAGDYYAYPWDMTDQLEETLKGCKLDKDLIREKVRQKYDDVKGETALISPDEFADTIINSIEKA